ncbi:hypothetical protein D9757_007110 [Collybiopsis confluens]|uniref:FHA domain-containing protein n=1 Tax=Collybiopsis confluens TaxID=2823264 RepID=A0A8H5M4N3_9AGAR|nr:hypothetical protein D9757_007110 [Collybiopsis confluens]
MGILNSSKQKLLWTGGTLALIFLCLAASSSSLAFFPAQTPRVKTEQPSSSDQPSVAMDLIPPPMLALQSKPASFPFASKYIPLPSNARTVLGSQVDDNTGVMFGNRNLASTNGWFATRRPANSQPLWVSPITLSLNHAEIWCDNGQIYIRDLDSAFGTFVNGVKITGATVLNSGDTLTLGSHLKRNANTPAHITDEQLLPITTKVTCLGVSSHSTYRT